MACLQHSLKKQIFSSVSRRTRHEQGLAMIVTLILLLLSSLAVLNSAQLGLIAEIGSGQSSDYARTRAAADALLRDAEMDILGRLPSYQIKQADGSAGYPCRPTAPGSLVPDPKYIGCRDPGGSTSAPNFPWFPFDWTEFQKVQDLLAVTATGCSQAICNEQKIPIENQIEKLKADGATYGQFTRINLTPLGITSNPILKGTGNDAKAWYWIEVFRYQPGLVPDNIKTPPTNGFVPIYRITVVARGLKSKTLVVLKEWFSPLASS